MKHVLESIGLMKVKKSMIGDLEGGLSGGERRRLAIGIELLKNSSKFVLFASFSACALGIYFFLSRGLVLG